MIPSTAFLLVFRVLQDYSLFFKFCLAKHAVPIAATRVCKETPTAWLGECIIFCVRQEADCLSHPPPNSRGSQ